MKAKLPAWFFSQMFAVLVLVGWNNALWANLTQQEVDDLMAEIDEYSRFASDFKANVYLQQKHREKGDLLYKTSVYRRDEDNRLMMLFLKPKSEAGKGYLVLDKNLFLYSPSSGDWTRVSEDRISGTDTNLADFDSWELSTKYKGTYQGISKLGKFPVYHIELNALPDSDVKVPQMQVWVEKSKHHILKVEEYAVSGKKLRTTYRTKWRPYVDEKKVTRYIPMETRVYDEVEKGNQTVMVIDKIILDALPEKIFSKAWLESKSR